jgi:hypothetical protein
MKAWRQRQLHSLSWPRPIHTTLHKQNLRRRSACARRTPRYRRRSAAIQEKLSRVPPGKPPAPFQGPVSCNACAAHEAGTSLRDEETARQPFRRCLVPGTTREHANAAPTALQGTRPAFRPAPTQATLPLCGVSITRPTKPRTGDQPGCHRGSCVSHVLRLAGHVAIRCYPEGPGSYARLFRAGIVCTIIVMVISGERT